MTIGKGPQAFPRTEYLRRLSAVKSEMARREVDALVVTSWPNITYLTGNLTRMFSLHALVVSLREEEPTLIVRRMDVPGCIHQTFLERSKVIGYSDDYVGKVDKNGFDAVIDFLHDAGLASSGVGMEFAGGGMGGGGSLSAHAAEKFRARLSNARIVDCSKAVDWVRLVKSDLEIEAMREAAAIADAAIMRAAEVIRPGLHEAELAAEIVAAQVRGGPNGKPASGVLPPLICSSPRTGTSHILWSQDRLRDGSQINIELSGNRHGYVAAIMRTFTIGEASDRLRRLHEAEVAGLEAALGTVRPGRTCGEISSAFYRMIEKMGFKKESRCGYAIGIDWVEQTASLQNSDTTELKPNMTFHLMLGNWVDEDFGYVISETFRVAESGAEVLTQAPRKLLEL
ncbi:MAG: aminopeptidase P family protein [Mesorhizobium sp.]|uniref:M24 family metallopeptidase n=1 Tax=Mesorhizobium sp. TaxID=1871066 RepID=UPI000FE6C37F|nr:Xaa-Pro peptidase family protein [Mesorhizobium sp.]RWB68716.1 MAG: aminopeptidase P family protein [Mesorhizobium sp.]